MEPERGITLSFCLVCKGPARFDWFLQCVVDTVQIQRNTMQGQVEWQRACAVHTLRRPSVGTFVCQYVTFVEIWNLRGIILSEFPA
jgi:hypothetical protein